MGARFRKALGSFVSVIVLLAGMLLAMPWRALDWVGRVMAGLDSPTIFDHLIDWLAANPRLAFDFGPWILVVASLSSLAVIHGSTIRRLLNRTSAVRGGTSSDPRERHAGLTDGYEYGLSLEQVVGEINTDKPNIFMSWQLGVRNCTDDPLRYRFDSAKFMIDGMVIPSPNFTGFEGVIPRGATNTLMHHVESDVSSESFKSDATAIFEFSILYGRTSGGFSRRWQQTLKITHFRPTPNTRLTYSVEHQSDSPVAP